MAENGKTLFSKRVPGGSRTYFFDVRQSDKTGNRYLILTESKSADGAWKRQSVMLFPDHAREWKQGIEEALDHLGV